jgi:hypothetical protein
MFSEWPGMTGIYRPFSTALGQLPNRCSDDQKRSSSSGSTAATFDMTRRNFS